MSRDIDKDAQKAVDDIKTDDKAGKLDLSQFINDIHSEAKTGKPEDFQNYLSQVNKDLQDKKVLPGLEVQ